jgi:hypothetical protein
MILRVRFEVLVTMTVKSTIYLPGCDAGLHWVTCQKMVLFSFLGNYVVGMGLGATQSRE